MDKQSEPQAESGAVSLTDSQWSEARRRAAIIGPLAASDSVSEWAAEEAGRRLGLTGRTVYALLRTWRKSGGNVPFWLQLPIAAAGANSASNRRKLPS